MKNPFYLSFLVLFFYGQVTIAQMPHDAIYMPKSTACLALTYTNSSWNKYWEGTLKRENLNIGTHTTQSIMPMIAIGLTDKFNVLVGVPYVATKTSSGNLMGQKGVQDLAVWLKYKFYENSSGFSIHAIGGGSVPLSNYVPDFLPMSIGLRTKSATGRLLVNYLHSTGLYFTTHASITGRSKIKVDRDAYLANGKMFNTNQVALPNTIDGAVRLGYLKGALQAEVFAERNACLNGDNIRRNDMPFPTNNTKMTVAGAYAKFQPKSIGLNARVGYVLDGLNAGQSLSYSVGLLCQFNNLKF